MDADASAADERIERAVLFCVLDVHPVSLTIGELIRALDAREDGGDRDAVAVELAVARLMDLGLLHRNGKLVSPTLAAVRFNRLQT